MKIGGRFSRSAHLCRVARFPNRPAAQSRRRQKDSNVEMNQPIRRYSRGSSLMREYLLLVIALLLEANFLISLAVLLLPDATQH